MASRRGRAAWTGPAGLALSPRPPGRAQGGCASAAIRASPVVGLRRLTRGPRPLPSFPTPGQARARVRLRSASWVAWTPASAGGSRGGILEVGTREASSPSVSPTLTPPGDLGGRASCPAPGFSRAVVSGGGRAGGLPSQPQSSGFHRDEPAIPLITVRKERTWRH